MCILMRYTTETAHAAIDKRCEIGEMMQNVSSIANVCLKDWGITNGVSWFMCVTYG